jgi:hypothetical protein
MLSFASKPTFSADAIEAVFPSWIREEIPEISHLLK